MVFACPFGVIIPQNASVLGNNHRTKIFSWVENNKKKWQYLREVTSKIKMTLGLLYIVFFWFATGHIYAGTCQGGDARACLSAGKPGEIMKLLEVGVNVLAIVVGIVAVINIIIGGIQYTASGGDPQKVKDARNRIYNTVYGIVAFVFLYAFMQWLIPGGIF